MSQTLYTLLLESAGRHGDRTAIDFGDSRLTYHALLNRVDRAATVLTRRGAEPGQRIAFCFRKSIDAIVTLFAIARTGAACVPLDPSWPGVRSEGICADAGIRLWTGTNLPPFEGVEPVLVTDPGGSAAAGFDDLDRVEPMLGDCLNPEGGIANILYTSGSTGRPKGVQITTRSLLHFSDWVLQTFGLTPDDRVANHAPYNFDLSTLDIFAAVRAGATMIPVPERIKILPYPMAKFIASKQITVWYSVPSALIMMQLRGKLPEHDLSHLRHVIFAGEVMPKPALQALVGQVPDAAWTNLYGPTETNVCTYYRVTPADLTSDAPLPIGVPITDTQVWIVDDSLRPVANGDSGELLVAGPTITTGYFGDPTLTAQRLVPVPTNSPASPSPPLPISPSPFLPSAYRTGDRVRRRADGVLLFEGRIDRMIKCRGHRIEPGEIEAVLSRHPAVREAAVVPIPDSVFGHRLKACLASRDGVTLEEASLLDFCRQRLPAYMLPDVWSFHDALPRTDREKVDLQALGG